MLVIGLVGEYSKSDKWKKHVRAFELMVILGVAGEVLSDAGVYIFSWHLQTISDNDVSAAQQKVTEADDRTKKAEAREAKLEQQATDRHIPPEQRKKMLAILRPRRGAKITIWYITDSGADTLAYTLEIQDVFNDAKWHVFHRPNLVSMDTPLHGFALEVQHDSPSNQQLARLAAKALAVTGYHVSPPKSIPPEPNEDAHVIVWVGGK